MIQLNPEYFKEYMKNEIREQIEWIGGEYTLKINDIDDLHDYTIESEEIDMLYYAMNSLLPLVFDEVCDFIDDEQDYWDPWREYYRNIM